MRGIPARGRSITTAPVVGPLDKQEKLTMKLNLGRELNHNQTVARPGGSLNHNQTVVRLGGSLNHNQTLVRR